MGTIYSGNAVMECHSTTENTALDTRQQATCLPGARILVKGEGKINAEDGFQQKQNQ